MANDHTRPTAETRAAEAEEARSAHEADRPPTADEEKAAAGQKLDPQVAQRAREAAERGAAQKGEGRIP
jgi:hypothetical protein